MRQPVAVKPDVAVYDLAHQSVYNVEPRRSGLQLTVSRKRGGVGDDARPGYVCRRELLLSCGYIVRPGRDEQAAFNSVILEYPAAVIGGDLLPLSGRAALQRRSCRAE